MATVVIDRIQVGRVPLGTNVLRARRSVAFPVSFERDTGFFEATGPFDLSIAAATRPELEAQLDAELAMLWHEYAVVAPDSLTKGAQRLRQELLEAFEEVPDAA